MSVQTMYLKLQVMGKDNAERKHIIDRMVETTLGGEIGGRSRSREVQGRDEENE